MAEALRLDILIDEDGSARRAVAEFAASMQKAGIDAESAAKQVDKFEQEYLAAAAAAKKATDAQTQATTATKSAGQAAEQAAAAKGRQAQASDALTSAVKRYAAPAVIGAAVMSTLNWAGSLSDLSKSTGISTTSLQKFEIIGKASGVTMDQIAASSLQLSNRLAGGDKSAALAVEKLGLNLDKLKASRPDETMLSFARALSKVEDPQQRVALAMDVMGRSGGAMIPVLLDMAEKWDTVSAKISEDGVKSLDDAGDSLDAMMGTGKALIASVLVPFAPLLTGISNAMTPLLTKFGEFMSFVLAPLDMAKWQAWTSNLQDAAAAMGYMVGIGPGVTGAMPGMPAAPARFGMPSGIAVPGDPMGGAAGQSWSFLNKFTGQRGKTAATGSAVTPYTANQWAGMQAVYGNMMGGGIPGFPGWAFPDVLSSSMSAQNLGIGFARGNQMVPFAGTVGMNAPGGGGIGSWLSGHKTQIAGAGLGLLSRFIPQGGRVGGALSGAAQGASMGAMFGPWGMGIGAAVGGIAGLFGGGSKDKKQINAMKGGEDFTAIKAKAEELGISMDKVFSAKKVEDFQKALQGVSDQIAAQEAESNKVHDAMARWGITIDQMGPKFKQTEMDKAAKGFAEDFYTLVNAGADVNTVIEKMGPEIGKFVHSSIEMGTQVPLEMKKIIEKMIEQGTLLDKNGEKFTDIGQIPFAENLNTQFSSLIGKLDELISRVFGLGDAFDSAAGSAGNFNNEAGNTPNVGGGPETNVASGGVVFGRGKVLHFQKGGFVPRGTDSVPAMLTPGEMVLARDQVKAMARGGRSGSVTVNLNIAGYLDSPQVQRNIARVVTDAIDRDVRMRRSG